MAAQAMAPATRHDTQLLDPVTGNRHESHGVTPVEQEAGVSREKLRVGLDESDPRIQVEVRETRPLAKDCRQT